MMEAKRCLLVEDDPEDQEFFMDAIHDLPSEVGCYAVGNGEEALFVLEKEGFSPDFIFTDLNMPRMNGFEFLKSVREIEKFRRVPVIVLSSDFNEENIQKAKQLGASAFYSKTRMGVLKDILIKYFSDPSARPTVL